MFWITALSGHAPQTQSSGNLKPPFADPATPVAKRRLSTRAPCAVSLTAWSDSHARPRTSSCSEMAKLPKFTALRCRAGLRRSQSPKCAPAQKTAMAPTRFTGSIQRLRRRPADSAHAGSFNPIASQTDPIRPAGQFPWPWRGMIFHDPTAARISFRPIWNRTVSALCALFRQPCRKENPRVRSKCLQPNPNRQRPSGLTRRRASNQTRH